MNQINIIGMGLGKNDLTLNHLTIINRCDVLIAGKRHLAMFDLPTEIQKIPVTGHIKKIVEFIKKNIDIKKIVVLASGDPLFYGIGSTLIKHFDKKKINIQSNISCVSAAFAAIKEPWHDAKIITLHGRKKNDFSFPTLAEQNKVVFLTDKENTPHFIAANLIEHNVDKFRFCILENIGHKTKEKVTWFEDSNAVIATNEFSQPNIVILKASKKKVSVSRETHFGMDDTLFQHSKGLITKSEIRCITLSKLKLIKNNHIMWDIGSGSGSLSIEAALQIPEGSIYAVEKNQKRIFDIKSNIKKFCCSNIKIINRIFPDGIDEIQKMPDRIFIGGGGKNLDKIIGRCCEKLLPSGVIVINTVMIQSFQVALSLLKKLNFEPQFIQIQISRSKSMPFGDRLEALNPVWIISGVKQ